MCVVLSDSIVEYRVLEYSTILVVFRVLEISSNRSEYSSILFVIISIKLDFFEEISKNFPKKIKVLIKVCYLKCVGKNSVCWSNAVFLNLFGSKSWLKANFETTAPVKEICQLHVAVMFYLCFFPFKIQRKSSFLNSNY